MALATTPWYRHLAGMYRPLDFAPRAKTPAPFKPAPIRRLDGGGVQPGNPDELEPPIDDNYLQAMMEQDAAQAPDRPMGAVPPELLAPSGPPGHPESFDTPPPSYLEDAAPPPSPSPTGVTAGYGASQDALEKAVKQAPTMQDPKWYQRALGAVAGFGAG